MKRLAATLLLAPLVWACGSLGAPSPSAPALSAGELLAAPTSLALGGMKLKAEATPYLNAPACDGETCVPSANFVVPVKLRSVGAQSPVQASSPSASFLSGLKVTGVYVITEGGVWRSGVAPSDSRRCVGTLNCLQAVGRGTASISSSDPVQVVLTFQDRAGKTYRLRDEKAVIDSPR